MNATGPVNLRRTPEQESEISKRRQRQTVRISRIANGYLINFGDTGENVAAMSRGELHAYVDEFFDKLVAEEARPAPSFRALVAAN